MVVSAQKQTCCTVSSMLPIHELAPSAPHKAKLSACFLDAFVTTTRATIHKRFLFDRHSTLSSSAHHRPPPCLWSTRCTFATLCAGNTVLHLKDLSFARCGHSSTRLRPLWDRQMSPENRPVHTVFRKTSRSTLLEHHTPRIVVGRPTNQGKQRNWKKSEPGEVSLKFNSPLPRIRACSNAPPNNEH